MSSELVAKSMRWFLCAVAFLACVTQCFGHLGEDHPLGTHDYFPDFPLTPHSVDVTEQFCLGGLREVREIPDGSGRFLALMEQNRLMVIDKDGSCLLYTSDAADE